MRGFICNIMFLLIFAPTLSQAKLLSWTEDLNLDFALQTGANRLEGQSSKGEIAPVIGFEARLGWQYEAWNLAIFTGGRYSYFRGATLAVDEITVNGDLNNRLINYGVDTRWEWGEDARHFVNLRAFLATSDFEVDPDDVSTGAFDDEKDLFIRGQGIAAGYGCRFQKRFFIQAIVQWTVYDRGVLIERIGDIDNELLEEDLRDDMSEYGVLLNFGWYNIF